MNNLPANYVSQAPSVAPAQKGFQFSMPCAQEMHHLIEFCKVMASCPFYHKLGCGGVMAIYLTAKENNLPFMSCLNGGLHTFDGKVTFSAQLINAMIINAGHRADVIHLDERVCRIRFWRCDRRKGENDTFEYEYNIDQAFRAKYLEKANWKSSPKDMLFSRCLTGGGRKFIPEVFVGILVTGELVGDTSDENVIPDVPLPVHAFKPPTSKIPVAADLVVAPVDNQNPDVPFAGYDDFVAKHDLSETGSKGLKYQYVQETSEKANQSIVRVINMAMKYEEIFEKRFTLWQSKKPHNPPVKADKQEEGKGDK